MTKEKRNEYMRAWRKKNRARLYASRKASPAHRAYMKKYLREYMRGYAGLRLAKLRAEFGGVCRLCGAPNRLQFAHLTPTGLAGKGRGQGARMRDIVRHPQHYILLCVYCHRDFDRKERMTMAKKVVEEAQTMGGELIPTKKKATKKTTKKKTKPAAKKTKKPAKKAKTTKPKKAAPVEEEHEGIEEEFIISDNLDDVDTEGGEDELEY